MDPLHDRTLTVTACGRICIGRRKVNLSHVFAGQKVGIKEVAEKIWLVSFMQYDLGFFDEECGRVEWAENPFGAQVRSPMCPESSVTDLPGIDQLELVAGDRFDLYNAYPINVPTVSASIIAAPALK
jgi:hypothetical protein